MAQAGQLDKTIKKEDGGIQLIQRNVTEYTFKVVGRHTGLNYSFAILAETQHEAIGKLKGDLEYLLHDLVNVEASSGS